MTSVTGFWEVGKTRLAAAVAYAAYTRHGMPVLWTSLNRSDDSGATGGCGKDDFGVAAAASPWAEGLSAEGGTARTEQITKIDYRILDREDAGDYWLSDRENPGPVILGG